MIKNYTNSQLKNKEINTPSPQTIQTILAYSKSLKVVKSKSLGSIEIISN